MADDDAASAEPGKVALEARSPAQGKGAGVTVHAGVLGTSPVPKAPVSTIAGSENVSVPVDGVGATAIAGNLTAESNADEILPSRLRGGGFPVGDTSDSFYQQRGFSALTKDELASTRFATVATQLGGITLDATAEVRETIESRFERLMGRVALLEATLAPALAAPTSAGGQEIGIGHNRPPVDSGPASMDELLEINRFVDLLKEQSPTPPSDPSPILALERSTSKTAAKIKEYLDNFGSEAFKGAGKAFGEEIGKRLAQAPFWIALYFQLGQVSEALIQWLAHTH
jgi:hypothetical protein